MVCDFRCAAHGCAWLLLILPVPAVAAAITACADGEGRLTYTQFDCPGGTEQATSRESEGMLSIVRAAALSDSERAALGRLEQTLARDRARWAASRRQTAARHGAERARARKRCESAERALDALAENRRHGYTATEDRRYDAEEARWNAVRRADC